MSRSNSKIWEDFMDSKYAQEEMSKVEKKAQAYSANDNRDALYNVDPGNKTELSKTVQTQGVNAGGASMVGGAEDRGPLYTTSPAAVPGGAEQYADASIEGLEDVASAMMNVAQKEATGNPVGTQDNAPESWDGMKAAGGKEIKNFTKQADALNEEEITVDSILSELEKEEKEEEIFEGGELMMDEMSSFAANKKKTVALLKELVKIANECDQKGQFADATEIDSVIKDEVQILLTASKKK